MKRNRSVAIDRIPDDLWNEAAEILVREIRAGTRIPNWLPKFLNGRDEFETRVIALLKQSHSEPRQEKVHPLREKQDG